jgi:phage gp36-like protein
MGIDLSKKKIIFVHGLASKPPAAKLHSLWTQCVIENIRMEDKSIARALELQPNVFESAYWANATPHHIEDDANYIKKLQLQVEKVIAERQKIKGRFHVGIGEELDDFFKDRGVDVVKLLAGALTVKDDVMKKFLREIELYDADQYIADRMRKPLEEVLRITWEDECDIALVSHSMGTFISYDVLWRFSHRNIAEFKNYKDKRVQLFVTMGSPLGEPAVRNILFSRFHKSYPRRQYPTNIDFWHNYSCLGDVVSHQDNFEDVFYKPMREINLFPKKPKYCAIDYSKLHNPFTVPSHSGNKGKEKRNPHKSFGYLVQPRFGMWVVDFLRGGLKYK